MNPTAHTIQLQGIGKVYALPVKELRPGDKVIWNYGYKDTVVSCTTNKTGTSYTLILKSDKTGKEGVRTKRAETLIGVCHLVPRLENITETALTPSVPGETSVTRATRGQWNAVQLSECPLPAYAYRVRAAAYPVALAITPADAALIANAPDLLRLVRIAREVFAAQVDEEHAAHGRTNWQSLYTEFTAFLKRIDK